MGSDIIEYTRGKWNDHLIRNGIDQDEIVPLAPLKQMEQRYGRYTGWNQAIRDGEHLNKIASDVIGYIDGSIDGGSPAGASDYVRHLDEAVSTFFDSVARAGGSNEEKAAILNESGLAQKLGALSRGQIKQVLGLDDE